MKIEASQISISELDSSFFKKARKFRFQHFLLYQETIPGPGRQIQYAVIASKKGVDKRATRRNRAKRRLLAAVRNLPHTAQVSWAGTRQWVLMANRSAIHCDWSQLTEDLARHLSEAQRGTT